MRRLTRRALLSLGGAGILASVTLGGCTTTRSGTTTTVILNVAKINDYVQAGVNAATTVIDIIRILPAFAAKVDTLSTLVNQLQVASANFTSEADGKLSVSYAEGNFKVLADSILDLVFKISDSIGIIALALLKATFNISATNVLQVQLVQNSIRTVAALLKALLRSSSDYSVASLVPGHNIQAERAAFEALGVKA